MLLCELNKVISESHMTNCCKCHIESGVGVAMYITQLVLFLIITLEFQVRLTF